MSDARRLIDEGLLDEAARELEKAPDTRLMLRLAAALQDRGRFDDALGWYRRILEVDPGNGDALLCLAVLHEEVDIEQARGFMDRYIALRGGDAFALGAPIVTLPGFLLPGRFTLGLYEEMNLEGCVARSPDEFVDIALRLGHDPGYREEIAGKISKSADRLFDRPDCGRALGEALLRIAEEKR